MATPGRVMDLKKFQDEIGKLKEKLPDMLAQSDSKTLLAVNNEIKELNEAFQQGIRRLAKSEYKRDIPAGVTVGVRKIKTISGVFQNQLRWYKPGTKGEREVIYLRVSK